MTDREIIRCIDDGANFYLRFFGDAAHMDCRKNEFYSCIRPKKGEHDVAFVFDVRLEDLAEHERLEKIAEINALQLPVWWGLQASDGLYRHIHGKGREKAAPEPADGDELYMAILSDDWENIDEFPPNTVVKRVDSPAAFEEWATAINAIMFGGYTDIHPVNHYRWCEKGLIHCFTCYYYGVAASFASVLNNDGICSLEFVATAPQYRRRGLARAVCAQAMAHSFCSGAKIITLRALQPGTRELYGSLGYKTYNHAL